MAEERLDQNDSADSPTRYVDGIDEFEHLLETEDRFLVDFFADWCGPCQMMSPIIDELAAETDATIVKVDIETLPQMTTRYDISSIPTFIAFADGRVVDRLVGLQEKEALAQALS